MYKGLFDVENSVWMFLNKMTDVFLLSVLWVVCSIPIVTAGAAAAGFYYCAAKISEGADYSVWRDFFAGFRGSFRTATQLYLLQLLAFAVLGFDLWVTSHMGSDLGWFLFTINGMLAAAVLCISFFAYPLAARYRFETRKILHDAAVIACIHLPHTLSLLVLLISGVAAALYFDYVHLFIPALVGYQIARTSVWIFEKQQDKQTKAGEPSVQDPQNHYR